MGANRVGGHLRTLAQAAILGLRLKIGRRRLSYDPA
jgi:hypothetical protein